MTTQPLIPLLDQMQANAVSWLSKWIDFVYILPAPYSWHPILLCFSFPLKPWPRSPLFVFVLKSKIENAKDTQQMLLNVFNPKTKKAREGTRLLSFDKFAARSRVSLVGGGSWSFLSSNQNSWGGDIFSFVYLLVIITIHFFLFK